MPFFKTELVHENSDGNETFDPIEVLWGGCEDLEIEKVWDPDGDEIRLTKEQEDRVIKQIDDDLRKPNFDILDVWE